MQVNAILVPTVTPVVPGAGGLASALPSNFSATLASSMQGAAVNRADVESAAATAAKSSTSGSGGSSLSVEAPNLDAKSGSKSDTDSADDPAGALGMMTLTMVSVVSTPPPLVVVGVPALTVVDKGKISLFAPSLSDAPQTTPSPMDAIPAQPIALGASLSTGSSSVSFSNHQLASEAASQSIESIEAQPPGPEGAFDFQETVVSLKRYPDTNLDSPTDFSSGVAAGPLAVNTDSTPSKLNLGVPSDALRANVVADAVPTASPGLSEPSPKAGLNAAQLPPMFDPAPYESMQPAPSVSMRSVPEPIQVSTNPAMAVQVSIAGGPSTTPSPVQTQSATPMTLAESLTPVSNDSLLQADSPASPTHKATSSSQDQPGPTVNTAATVAGQLHIKISGVTIIAEDQSPSGQSAPADATSFMPSVLPSSPFPLPPPTSAWPATSEPASGSNKSSDQPVVSSAGKQNPSLPTNIFAAASAAPTPTWAAIPPPQSPIVDNHSGPASEPPTTLQPAAPKAVDAKDRNSTPRSSTPVGSAATEPASSSSPAYLDIAPAQRPPHDDTTTFDVTTAAAQTASASGNGFAIADNLAKSTPNTIANSSDSSPAWNLDSRSKIPALTFASQAATAGDLQSSATTGAADEGTPVAAFQTTASDKKSSAANQTKDNLSNATSAPVVSTAIASAKDGSATLTASAPPAPAPPSQMRPDPAPALRQVHHMLDSAPPASSTPPAAPPAADAAVGHMHVGIRTEAFGAVEIHTVVKQSQVGITLHGDRDLTRWFSSEVPSLESGLNQHHLNLTAVDLDSGRSGIQTASSFQQGQSRQNFSQPTGAPSAALPEPETVPETAPVNLLPSDLSLGPAVNRVSILV
jgi:hypothetical protein